MYHIFFKNHHFEKTKIKDYMICCYNNYRKKIKKDEPCSYRAHLSLLLYNLIH
ncbi:IS3 family transposase [Paenibacillus sp. J45TS6]|uniref:IS3 family transposase n=1 Tax=unclassified Paenibacillus TaxID=185978 RepID=UPI0035B55D00